MPCSTASKATLEERTVAAHRLYLTALMRIEALDEADAACFSEQAHIEAEAVHLQTFATLNLFLNELGYVPKGLATRADLAEEPVCEVEQREGASGKADQVSLMRAARAPTVVTRPPTIMLPSRTVRRSV